MVLFLIYESITNVLLLNILIAGMSASFAKVTQDEGLRFLHSKAEIIDELEVRTERLMAPAANGSMNTCMTRMMDGHAAAAARTRPFSLSLL